VAEIVLLHVAGTPWPEGSLKAFVRNGKPVIVHDNPAALEAWRSTVRAKAIAARSSFLRRPVSVDMFFYLQRPKSHYRTGRNAHLLRDAAPPYPVSKFDGDKLARAVLDALTGVLYDDDGQVVRHSAEKRYAPRNTLPGAVIRVREVI
jgi:Holliday junction resolvase RusA-like endonuclease